MPNNHAKKPNNMKLDNWCWMWQGHIQVRSTNHSPNPSNCDSVGKNERDERVTTVLLDGIRLFIFPVCHGIGVSKGRQRLVHDPAQN